MPAPAAFINPNNPFKSIQLPTFGAPPPAPVRRLDPLNRARVIQPGLGPPMAAPGIGPPPPAPVGNFAGGGNTSFGMGNHFNQRYDKDTGEWVPLTIDGTAGPNTTPNANQNMGLIPNYLQSGSFESRKSQAAPPSPEDFAARIRGFKDGGTTQPGETAVVGESGPEVIQGQPDGTVAVLPNDLLRLGGGAFQIKPGSPHLGPGANFSTGVSAYGVPPPEPVTPAAFSGSLPPDAPPPGFVAGPSAPSTPGNRAPSPMELAMAARAKMFGGAPSRYANELDMRKELAANKGQPDISDGDSAPPESLADQAGIAPPASSIPPAPGNAPDWRNLLRGNPSMPGSGAQPMVNPLTPPPPAPTPVPKAPPPPAPNLPPAQQMNGLAMPDHDVNEMWDAARSGGKMPSWVSPKEEQYARRFARQHPSAMIGMDAGRQAAAVKANQAADKFNAEQRSKNDALKETAKFHAATQAHRDRMATETERIHTMQQNSRSWADKNKYEKQLSDLQKDHQQHSDLLRTIEARHAQFKDKPDALAELNLMAKDEDPKTLAQAIKTFDMRHQPKEDAPTFTEDPITHERFAQGMHMQKSGTNPDHGATLNPAQAATQLAHSRDYLKMLRPEKDADEIKEIRKQIDHLQGLAYPDLYKPHAAPPVQQTPVAAPAAPQAQAPPPAATSAVSAALNKVKKS